MVGRGDCGIRFERTQRDEGGTAAYDSRLFGLQSGHL